MPKLSEKQEQHIAIIERYIKEKIKAKLKESKKNHDAKVQSNLERVDEILSGKKRSMSQTFKDSIARVVDSAVEAGEITAEERAGIKRALLNKAPKFTPELGAALRKAVKADRYDEEAAKIKVTDSVKKSVASTVEGRVRTQILIDKGLNNNDVEHSKKDEELRGQVNDFHNKAITAGIAYVLNKYTKEQITTKEKARAFRKDSGWRTSVGFKMGHKKPPKGARYTMKDLTVAFTHSIDECVRGFTVELAELGVSLETENPAVDVAADQYEQAQRAHASSSTLSSFHASQAAHHDDATGDAQPGSPNVEQQAKDEEEEEETDKDHDTHGRKMR